MTPVVTGTSMVGLLLLLLLAGITAFLVWGRKGSARLDEPAASATRRLPGSGAKASARRNEPRWVPAGSVIQVQGFTLPGGLIYVGTHTTDSRGRFQRADPSVIDPSLQVGRGHPVDDGEGMGYWPSYGGISPGHRGAYLQWLAGGRRDPDAYIGFVFLFFYGLERRALVDGEDRTIISTEVRRLLSLYSSSRSFFGYATSLIAVTTIEGLPSLDERGVYEQFGSLAEDSPTALAAVLGWFHTHARPLPVEFAALVAQSTEGAKRSVVVTRSKEELLKLFALRYREKFGDGVVLESTARPVSIPYHPASGALLSSGQTFSVRLPDVLGSRRQFKPLVGIWNDCVDDLKRFASAQRRAGDEAGTALTPQMWEAMPPDLRAHHDHPDKERWEEQILSADRCGPGHLMSASALAVLGGLPPRDRYPAAQLRKLADTAMALGFAIEPDPRATASGVSGDARFVLWRSRILEAPDPRTYGPISTVLKLAVSVAAADNDVSQEELAIVTLMIKSMFVLDAAMVERVEAIRDLLVLHPAKIGGLTKKLAAAYTPEQLAVLGRILVAIAAADGFIKPEEHKSLRLLFKNLGLTPAALNSSIAASGARLASDEPVAIVDGQPAAKGSAVTAPAEVGAKRVELNQNAIEEILKDTNEVAALLANVLDTAEDDDGPATAPQVTAPSDPFAAGLEPQYRPVLLELLSRQTWSAAEIRVLAGNARLMPGAILETINAWSDETLGEFLIVDSGEWTIRTDLVKGASP